MLRIQPSRHPAGEVPEISNRGITAAQGFLRGSPTTLASGLVSEHAGATTVTDLFGFAQEDVVAGASLGANSTEVNVAVANRDTVFVGMLYNTSAVVAPDIDNIDVDYGLLDVSGEWVVDETDTTNVHVKVVDFDLNIGGVGVVFFKVLESVLQFP